MFWLEKTYLHRLYECNLISEWRAYCMLWCLRHSMLAISVCRLSLHMLCRWGRQCRLEVWSNLFLQVNAGTKRQHKRQCTRASIVAWIQLNKHHWHLQAWIQHGSVQAISQTWWAWCMSRSITYINTHWETQNLLSATIHLRQVWQVTKSAYLALRLTNWTHASVTRSVCDFFDLHSAHT